MSEPSHILVVDDDRDIRTLLSEYLEKNGYKASAVAEGKAMRRLLEHTHVDLIVLDLMLPGEDGLSLCRELRKDSQVPIIMLTALGDDVERIVGMEMGADDYIAKPFNPRELLVRIKAVLRRAAHAPRDPLTTEVRSYRFGNWRLDTTTRELSHVDGNKVDLSGAEFRLLSILLNHPTRVLSRTQLMEMIRGRDADPFDRSIDVRISRLRQTLGDDARSPQIIKTVYGEGYLIGVPVERIRGIMKWLPQSLFARLLMALIGVVGVTLVVIALLIVRERRDLALWGSSAWNAAAVIAETSQKLATLDRGARAAAIEHYRAEPIEIETTRRGPPPQLERAIEQSEQAFARRLRRDLNDDFKVSIVRPASRDGEAIRVIAEGRRSPEREGPESPPTDGARQELQRGPSTREPGPMFFDKPPDNDGRLRSGFSRARSLDVTVELPDGERVLFRTNTPSPGPPLPRQIFVELGALTLALALVLFLMTRNITRPLSELAQAADAVGKGAKVAPLPERGARELRDATRAFNTMQDRLHRYLDSRTRVLAAMSHDLRTPLTRMRLRAETIDDDTTRERITADLDEMSLMVTGALGLFKGLNDSEAAVPLRIDDVLDELQKEFTELGGDATFAGKSDAPILAKPNAIKRCLSNLLHNAVKYGERAHVTLSDSGAQVQVRIRDEGPGIPEAQLEQVFEPFFRLESSRNRDSGGTGLGLCIARDIAEAHGGSIVLRNHPDQGLEVTLTLPRKT